MTCTYSARWVEEESPLSDTESGEPLPLRPASPSAELDEPLPSAAPLSDSELDEPLPPHRAPPSAAPLSNPDLEEPLPPRPVLPSAAPLSDSERDEPLPPRRAPPSAAPLSNPESSGEPTPPRRAESPLSDLGSGDEPLPPRLTPLPPHRAPPRAAPLPGRKPGESPPPPIRLPPRRAPRSTNRSTPLPGLSQADGEGTADDARLLGLGSSQYDGGVTAKVGDNLTAPTRKSQKRACQNDPEDGAARPSQAAKRGKRAKLTPVRYIYNMLDNMLTPLLQRRVQA